MAARLGPARGRTSTGGEPNVDLASQLSDLARSLQGEPDLDKTLHGIVHAAVVSIPGATFAGITRVDRKGLVTTPASTDEVVLRIDQVQYRTGEGPCLDAIRNEATVRVDDLRIEARWPHFATAAADLGVRSMLAFQLYVREEDLGALNLYATGADAFDDHDEQVGLLLASHAAIALIGAQEQQQLRSAMDHRDVIGQAQGILMERHRVTATVAFRLLVQVSQNTHRKLHDIAAELADTGELR